MKIGLAIVSLVLIAIGALWTLQGADMVGGSFMTGDTKWLYIGIVIAIAGLALLVAALRLTRIR